MFQPWKLFVVGAIGTCVVVNISFLTLSIRKPSLPVDNKPYEAGLDYQNTINSSVALKEQGWRLQVDRGETGTDGQLTANQELLTVRLKDPQDNTLLIEKATLRAVNPAHPDKDSTMILTPQVDGAVRSNQPLAHGQWILNWTFQVNGKEYRINEKRFLP